VQDPRLAAEMPLQFLRGRLAGTLGLPSDVANLVRTPMPMEMYGDVDYGPQTQVPYGSQELLRTLPLPPQGPAQSAAANVGAVVPLTPMEALQAARAARQAALATGKALGPTVARMSEGYLQRQGLMPGVVPTSPKQSSLKVKPPTDDVYEVMDATFNYGKLGGNKNIPIDKLTGGVRMSDPAEVKRVKELAAKISGDNGYISRIIVDDKGNVLEGQHRLEALRLLGEKNVPVAVIEDLSNKYNIPAMKKSLEGQLRSDNVNQMVKRAIDAIEESGSVDKALTDFAMPAQFQKPFQDALRASMKMPPAPQKAALDVAQQRATLPVENKNMLSYRGSHTAPGPDFGAPLYDLTGGGQMYPADVYSAKAAQYYGTGYPKADREAFALAQRVRGNPDAEITMYRAVPKDEKITAINAGDWVTLSKDYAKTHGESVLDNNYKILSQKVKAKDLWTNADSIHEFGYQPQTQKP
jgi:hypothetical protein